jgi:hypothetical protein
VATLAVTRRFDLTDEQWARLAPLLPVATKPGRPSKWTKRQLIDGIRWRVRVGAPWRDVPDGWEVSVDSTVAQAHQHAAGARTRPDEQKESPGGVGDGAGGEPADHALGRSRGGLTTKIHLACEQGQKVMSLLVTAGSGETRRSSRPSWRRSVCPGWVRHASHATGQGPGRQGLQLPRQPRLPAQTRHRVHDPAQGRPDPSPQEPGHPGRPAAGVLHDRLPAASRRRVRHQPAQTPPRRRYAIRQARRPLRSHPPVRHHQRVRDHLDRIALLLLLQAGHIAYTPSTWAPPSLPTRAVRVGRGGP